jgi:DNA mismatch repair protein MutS
MRSTRHQHVRRPRFAWATRGTLRPLLHLFATHYFELTKLAQEYREVANVHLDAVEHKDKIVFLHALEEGPASQSYGLRGRLAGVPQSVLARARQRLEELEAAAAHARNGAQPDLFVAPAPAATVAAPHPVLSRLAALDVDALSPRQALELLYELRHLLDAGD